jgi:hypothetical protein
LQWQLTFQSVLFIIFCLLLPSNGINVGIGHTCNTMRVYHDTIITCSTADSFCSLFPYTHNPRSHTCAYVTHMKNNVLRSFEIRQVINDTRISNGQWRRCDVTKCAVMCGACAVAKVIQNNLHLRHIHVKKRTTHHVSVLKNKLKCGFLLHMTNALKLGYLLKNLVTHEEALSSFYTSQGTIS